jgi:hypothetical protein
MFGAYAAPVNPSDNRISSVHKMGISTRCLNGKPEILDGRDHEWIGYTTNMVFIVPRPWTGMVY